MNEERLREKATELIDHINSILDEDEKDNVMIFIPLLLATICMTYAAYVYTLDNRVKSKEMTKERRDSLLDQHIEAMHQTTKATTKFLKQLKEAEQ